MPVEGLPDVLATRIATLPVETLERLADALLDFTSLSDLEHWLDERR